MGKSDEKMGRMATGGRGFVCMGMAGCGSEEKTRRTQMQNRKVRLHQRQEKKDRHRSRRIQKEVKRQNYRQQSQTMQRRDLLSQILQRCSLNFAVVQVDGQRILPLRRMALFRRISRFRYGDTGDGYPNGTMYYRNFSGHFTNLTKVDDDTLMRMSLADISYQNTVGDTEILDDMLYVYTDVYGLGNGYLPDLSAGYAERKADGRRMVLDCSGK